MAAFLTEDEIQAASTRAAALAMGEWLMAAGITGKRIEQLHMHELENMAMAAITGWLNKRQEIDLDSIIRDMPGMLSSG
jgi:hypothetical protein